ncbi:MAG: YhjD/YihY/BrkB family envelope integrity protein [Acidobacteriota bacterium]
MTRADDSILPDVSEPGGAETSDAEMSEAETSDAETSDAETSDSEADSQQATSDTATREIPRSSATLWRDVFLEPLSWRRLRHIGHLLVLTGRKASADEISTQSAALSFITLVSLVPLLASLSHFGAAFFISEQDDLIALITRVLPYTQERIEITIRQFVEQSQSLRGFGFVAFLLTSLTAFSTIERIINQIWNVSDRRPLRSRLNSFVLVLCYGPLLIGLTYSALFVLSRNRTFEEITSSLPVQLVPFVVTLVGLTMLYWQVPYTRVDLRAAAFGGLCATVALELLQAGFGYYVAVARQVSVVYGSFGTAFFFILSIQLSWMIVLGGSELAYCSQNFTYLVRSRRQRPAIEGSWLGLAAMVLIVERFRAGEPITGHEELAGALNLQPADTARIVEPLLDAGLLREHRGEHEGYLLACDPYTTSMEQVVDLYETLQWLTLQPLPEPARSSLEALRERLTACRRRVSDDVHLVDLLHTADEPRGTNPTGS